MTTLKRPASPSVLESPRLAPLSPQRARQSSHLTNQLQDEKRKLGNVAQSNQSVLDRVNDGAGLLQTPTKTRSVSDAVSPTLSPSPKFRETLNTTRDDISVLPDPTTPRRPSLTARGLSLQMPPRDLITNSTANFISRIPLSPKLDPSSTYGAPATVLPRRSRGLDFSRACTNLHHSTLADQSSPDSSPVMPGRGVMIPSRKGFPSTSNSLGSPGSNAHSLWSTMAHADRNPTSSSIGSVNMMDSDSMNSSSSDEGSNDVDDTEDPILTTPQVLKSGFTASPFNPTNTTTGAAMASPAGDWLGNYSPAAASLMSFQRARLRSGRSRKSSSSGSSLASPSPASPPVLKSVESGSTSGYFVKELVKSRAESRRSSLSWGTKDLHISSGGESDEGGATTATPFNNASTNVAMAVTTATDEKRGVIRRAVTRRGNLLPKTKNFARIRAALMEEGAPVDSEVRREAEIIRQVRESDMDGDQNSLLPNDLSPNLLPTVPGLPDSLEDIPEDEIMASNESTSKRRSGNFGSSIINNGKDFWESLGPLRTPPPPLFSRRTSSVLSDDTVMESPVVSSPSSSITLSNLNPPLRLQSIESSNLSTSQSQNQMPSAAEISRRVNNKRRREDDLDPLSFKRRAVSPGMSVQNSPVLTQSPVQNWGTTRGGKDAPLNGHAAGERTSGGSVVSQGYQSQSGPVNIGTKRVGFQGMNDTNDGLMNMSIE